MPQFATRLDGVQPSFIREILKVTANPEIISFAGGLPNPALFPVEEMAEVAAAVLRDQGRTALQYSTTEGDPELRACIAERYKAKKGLDVAADDILITTGSQQCLDLVGKVLIDRGSPIVLERPGYLGAIQAFSFFGPVYRTVELADDGPDLEALARALEGEKPRFFYAVPNFQNPSGVTYSAEKRRAAADLLSRNGVTLVEDDPYGELRFLGQDQQPVSALMRDHALLLGTFSKIAAPGFRIGWVVAPKRYREKLVIAKQAADLHTSTLVQRILVRYLREHDIDAHIARIRECYGNQRRVMVEAIERHFPEEVRFTRPEGGMFLWAAMPEGCASMDLFERAIARKVAFVPGRPFYVDGTGENTLRLNYSNSDPERIEEGVRRLGESLKDYLTPPCRVAAAGA
ncbi:aminotransferase-like domain-containing protein [Desulfovibrio sp.]